MPVIAVLLLLGFIILVFVLPISASSRAAEAKRAVEELRARLNEMRARLAELQQDVLHWKREAQAPAKSPEPLVPVPSEIPDLEAPAAFTAPNPSTTPPPLPQAIKNELAEVRPAESLKIPSAGAPKCPPPVVKLPALNMEQFMGVKLFAWLGGLALFFGIVFFVKYAFEHNLIPPAARVAIGFVIGAGVMAGGLLLHRNERYRVLAQTLCASGTLILYGVTYAARSLYGLFDPLVAFSIMSLITVAAFLLAVRLNALVVAILGMAGGFLTPILCSTGQDNPPGLFGYIALLDIGLLMVARKRRWFFLASLAAAGTVLIQAGWFMEFFESGHYAEGLRTLVPMGMLLGFVGLFSLAAWRTHKEAEGFHPAGSALGMGAVAMIYAFAFLQYPEIGSRPWLLYGYILLLNLALMAGTWFDVRANAASFVVALATFAHLFYWTADHLTAELLPAALIVYLVFGSLHIGFIVLLERRRPGEPGRTEMMKAMPAVVMALMLMPVFRLTEPSFVQLYGAIFLLNAFAMICAWRIPRAGIMQWSCGMATFVHLGIWTMRHMTGQNLGAALTAYLVFGVMHTVFTVLREKNGAERAPKMQIGPWLPVIALAVMLLPVLKLDEVSVIIWPAVLFADLLAIIAAGFVATLTPVLAALVLTMIATLVWLLKLPVRADILPDFLVVLGGFAVVFAGASCWLSRRLLRVPASADGREGGRNSLAFSLPVISAILPFLLLIMTTLRLQVPDPSAVFGIGLLLVLMLLGLARLSGINQLVMAGLGCITALESVWHADHFHPGRPWIPLFWYLGFYALFAIYPFIFRSAFRETTLPWTASALSGIVHPALVYFTVHAAFPGMADRMGLLPAAFAVPALAGLFAVLKLVKSEGEPRLSQLAWFGGVALLFITLIFPIQLHRQWITLGWALEGAALIWLFQRVPHQGLRLCGLALLSTAFARLAINPMVLEYHQRSATPVFNWYLYTYGIAAAALFLGARWLKEPHHKVGDVDARALLWGGGGVLLFWLLNIEIADCFSPAGAEFTIVEFTGINFARDMTYSIAWGIFALVLLIIGFWVNAKPARYAAIGLLALTLLKVFLHDLASLESIYRIAALIGVAIIALAASFLYQRFFERTKE